MKLSDDQDRAAGKRFWDALLAEDEVDSSRLDEALLEASSRLAVPVIWLLGRAQSGKTSIVRALTGSPQAEIGDGFRPCTRSARFYDFPAEAPVVRFLDTRGLGEVDYDPSEDLAWCEARAQLLVAVMRVGDGRPQALLATLKAIRKRQPGWPLLLVQTCLHEAYPPGAQHVMPYPFDAPDWTRRVPQSLCRQMLAQREFIGRLPGHGAQAWVAVDLTDVEDGYAPPNYGLEALCAALAEVSSQGLAERLRSDPKVRSTIAAQTHPVIVRHSLSAAALGLTPVVGLWALPVLQARMLRRLASHYRYRWTAQSANEFFGLLGIGVLAGVGLRVVGVSIFKLAPVWGQTLGAIWGASSAAALTYAMGKAACLYIERSRAGLAVDAPTLQAVYREAFERGHALATSSHRGPS